MLSKLPFTFGRKSVSSEPPVDGGFETLLYRFRFAWIYLLGFGAVAQIYEPLLRPLLVWKAYWLVFVLVNMASYFLNGLLRQEGGYTSGRARLWLMLGAFQIACTSSVVAYAYIRFKSPSMFVSGTVLIVLLGFGSSYLLRAHYKLLRSIVLAWFLPPAVGAVLAGGAMGYEIAMFEIVSALFCLHLGRVENEEYWRLIHANRQIELARKRAESSARLEAELLADRMYQEGIVSERTRMAAELHDTLSAGLAAISLQLETAVRQLPPNAAESLESLVLARAMLRHYLNEARQSVSELQRPAKAVSLQQSLCEALEPICQGSGVDLTITTEADLPQLSLKCLHHAIRISQEAVRNGLLHGSPSRINIDAQRLDSGIVLAVTDDGQGFEGSAAAKGHFGLEIMKDRARKISGSLQIASQPGKGTRVTLTLPTTDQLRGAKLLLVENPVFAGRDARSLLLSHGVESHDLRQAASGKRALQTFQEDRPAISIIDLRLPDMSGIELLKAMRACDPAAIALVFSESEAIEQLRAAIEAGASGYVLNEAVDELPAAVSTALEGGLYFPKAIKKPTSASHLLDQLSPAEGDVLEQLILGFNDDEIADRLGISKKAVRREVERLSTRLGAANRDHVVSVAASRGLVVGRPPGSS